MPRLFGTLFHANYLTRALAMYRSLERHSVAPFELVMLCMDDTALRIFRELALPQTRAIPIGEIEAGDPALAAVKPTRNIGEYCWTCTPALLTYLLDRAAPGETASYLDADLMFFSDPQPVFDEWAENDIAIHEHRFAPPHRHMERASGRFNVGWVGIRNSAEGRACLARWRAQCIAECTVDTARGLCGDQTYLNEWPSLYPHLAILKHRGVGLGPWNLDDHELAVANGVPIVDGVPVVFYHYHAMRIVHDRVFGRIAVNPSDHYPLSRLQKRLIYRPYARALRAAAVEAAGVAAGPELPGTRFSLRTLAKAMRRNGILFAGR